MGLFDIFGGGRGAGDLPTLDTSGYDKYSGPITGLSESGQLQEQAMEQQRMQDLSRNRGIGASNTATSMSNQTLFGADRGAMERAQRAGDQNMSRGTAQTNMNASNVQNQLKASDYAAQENRQYDATIGAMDAKNQATLAQYGADQAANAAHDKAKSGLFGSLGSIAGTAFGGPIGGMAGGALGKMLA